MSVRFCAFFRCLNARKSPSQYIRAVQKRIKHKTPTETLPTQAVFYCLFSWLQLLVIFKSIPVLRPQRRNTVRHNHWGPNATPSPTPLMSIRGASWIGKANTDVVNQPVLTENCTLLSREKWKVKPCVVSNLNSEENPKRFIRPKAELDHTMVEISALRKLRQWNFYIWNRK